MKRGGSGRQVWVGAGLNFPLNQASWWLRTSFGPAIRDHLRHHVLLPRITPSPEEWLAFWLCRHLGPTVCPVCVGRDLRSKHCRPLACSCCLRVNSCRLSVPSVPSLAKSRTVQQGRRGGRSPEGFLAKCQCTFVTPQSRPRCRRIKSSRLAWAT